MKIRTNFVSNSSSTSFVIRKCDVTEEQKHRILQIMKYLDSKYPNVQVYDEGSYVVLYTYDGGSNALIDYLREQKIPYE